MEIEQKCETFGPRSRPSCRIRRGDFDENALLGREYPTTVCLETRRRRGHVRSHSACEANPMVLDEDSTVVWAAPNIVVDSGDDERVVAVPEYFSFNVDPRKKAPGLFELAVFSVTALISPRSFAYVSRPRPPAAPSPRPVFGPRRPTPEEEEQRLLDQAVLEAVRERRRKRDNERKKLREKKKKEEQKLAKEQERKDAFEQDKRKLLEEALQFQLQERRKRLTDLACVVKNCGVVGCEEQCRGCLAAFCAEHSNGALASSATLAQDDGGFNTCASCCYNIDIGRAVSVDLVRLIPLPRRRQGLVLTTYWRTLHHFSVWKHQIVYPPEEEEIFAGIRKKILDSDNVSFLAFAAFMRLQLVRVRKAGLDLDFWKEFNILIRNEPGPSDDTSRQALVTEGQVDIALRAYRDLKFVRMNYM